MRTKLALLALTLSSPLAWGHGTGHGPVVPGKGPNGGTMSAIVSALDADQGPKAKLVGIAEFFREGDALTVSLLNEKKKPVTPKTPMIEVKWIFLGSAMEKPEVVKAMVQVKNGRFSHKFDSTLLSQAETVEVILPYWEKSELKHVFLTRLR